MKKYIFLMIGILVTFSLYPQTNLRAIDVKECDEGAFIVENICERTDYAKIIVSANLKKLQFNFLNCGSCLKKVVSKHNMYILCVEPNDDIDKYNLNIEGEDIRTASITIKNIKKGERRDYCISIKDEPQSPKVTEPEKKESVPPPPLLKRHKTSKKPSFGGFVGISQAKQSSDAWYYDDANKPKTGLYAGVLYEMPLSKYFSFQPELLFVQKGSKGKAYTSEYYIYEQKRDYISDVYVESTMKLHYLELPLNLICNISSTNENSTFFFGAGFSIAYGLSGKLELNPSKEGVEFKLSDEDKKLKVFKDDSRFLNRFDCGINLLAGYQYKYFFVKMGYNWGLTNIATNKEDEWAYFNNNYFNLSGGVKF